MDINVLALREDGMWGMIKVGGLWGGVGRLWGDEWSCYVYYRLQYFILSIFGSCTYARSCAMKDVRIHNLYTLGC